jgi:organic radical activating enzyme
MLRVNEMFLSFQGEGPTIGLPTLFLRFAGCNLKCSYCDTDFENYREFSVQQVISLIESKNHDRAKLISLTGGEPLLQDPEELFALMNKLHWNGEYSFLVETNATLPQRLNQLLMASGYDLPDYVHAISADIKTDATGEFMKGVEQSQLEFARIMAKFFHNNILKVVITPEMVDYGNGKTKLYTTLDKMLNFFSDKDVHINLTPVTVGDQVTAFKTEDLFNIYEQVQRAVNNNNVKADIRIIPQMQVVMRIP